MEIEAVSFPKKKDKYEMPFDKGDGTRCFDFKGG